jgi:hypothetical protein
VLLQANIRIVELELPFAVQIHPQLALELWLRILGAGNLLHMLEGERIKTERDSKAPKYKAHYNVHTKARSYNLCFGAFNPLDETVVSAVS